MSEHFKCETMRAVLSVASCGKRHRIAGIARKVQRSLSPTCAACGVGASHAAGLLPGAWPGGGLIDRAPLLTLPSSAPPKATPSARRWLAWHAMGASR